MAPERAKMKPKISLITLGVTDLGRATRFYRDGLGLPAIDDNPGVVFFQLEGTWLGLFPRDDLAEDAGVDAHGSGFRGISLAHNVGSEEQVREVLALAESAGGRLVKAATDTFWGGYAGWFADPDGHLWEVAWNPHMDLT